MIVVFKTRSGTVGIDYVELTAKTTFYRDTIYKDYICISITLCVCSILLKCGTAQRRCGRVPVPSLRLYLLDSTAVCAHGHICM